MTDVQQKNIYAVEEDSEQSSFNFQKLYTIFILNWKWFVLSIIICLGCSYLYLRYKSPVYATSAKLLIKDDSNNKSASAKALSAVWWISESSAVTMALTMR